MTSATQRIEPEMQAGPRPDDGAEAGDPYKAANAENAAMITVAAPADSSPAEDTAVLVPVDQLPAPILPVDELANAERPPTLERRRHEHLIDAVHVLLNVVNYAGLPDIDWGTTRQAGAQIVLCGHIADHLAKAEQMEILRQYASHFGGEIVERTYDVDRREGRESWAMRGEQGGVSVWVYAIFRADGEAAAA